MMVYKEITTDREIKKETGNLVEYLLCTVQIGQTSGKSSVSS